MADRWFYEIGFTADGEGLYDEVVELVTDHGEFVYGGGRRDDGRVEGCPVEREKVETLADELARELDWCRRCFDSILARRPVRDASEMRHAVDAVLDRWRYERPEVNP